MRDHLLVDVLALLLRRHYRPDHVLSQDQKLRLLFFAEIPDELDQPEGLLVLEVDALLLLRNLFYQLFGLVLLPGYQPVAGPLEIYLPNDF